MVIIYQYTQGPTTITATGGPTKHRKELQGTENSAKNYKVLQGTTRYFQTKHQVAENTTRNYKVLLNQRQGT